MTSPRRVARGRGMQSLELKPQRQRVRVAQQPRRAPVGPPKMGGPLPPTRVRVAQPIQFTTPPNRPTMPPPQQVRGGAGLQDTRQVRGGVGLQTRELTQKQLEDLRQAQERYNLMMQDPEFQRRQKTLIEKMNKQRPLVEQFQRGEISVKDLRGSGLFTPQQLRTARLNRRMERMSPEERLNFMRREAERRQRRLGRRRRRPLGLGTANRPLKPAPQRPRRRPRRGSMQSPQQLRVARLQLRPQRRRVRRRVR